MKMLKHIAVVFSALFLCLFLPGWFLTDGGKLFSGGVDAVSSASMDLPDQPSGQYVVIVNRDRHPSSMEDWTAFFEEREVGVIMEDISCLAAAADADGIQLAERYQARLAENQMTLTRENSLLVVSRAENGLYDVVILSKEMADSLNFDAVYARPEAAVLRIGGPAT